MLSFEAIRDDSPTCPLNRYPLGRAWYYCGHKRAKTQRPSFDMVKLNARSRKRYNMLGFRLARGES